jgi:hypothetical protein
LQQLRRRGFIWLVTHIGVCRPGHLCARFIPARKVHQGGRGTGGRGSQPECASKPGLCTRSLIPKLGPSKEKEGRSHPPSAYARVRLCRENCCAASQRSCTLSTSPSVFNLVGIKKPQTPPQKKHYSTTFKLEEKGRRSHRRTCALSASPSSCDTPPSPPKQHHIPYLFLVFVSQSSGWGLFNYDRLAGQLKLRMGLSCDLKPPLTRWFTYFGWSSLGKPG